MYSSPNIWRTILLLHVHEAKYEMTEKGFVGGFSGAEIKVFRQKGLTYRISD